jgi:cytochrome bd-type quinol oxidase subunit 1
VGDLHGLNTVEHQPAKIAAIEGQYGRHALFHYSFAVPGAAILACCEASMDAGEATEPYRATEES